MPSWRDSASQQSQQDLDELLNVALGFAQSQLQKHGGFFPYAAAVGSDGQPKMLAALSDPQDEHPKSIDVIDACIRMLASQRATIRAAAVVSDVRLPEVGGDAIAVDLEHAEGHTIRVLLPYKKHRFRKGIEYGAMQAEAGQRRVW